MTSNINHTTEYKASLFNAGENSVGVNVIDTRDACNPKFIVYPSINLNCELSEMILNKLIEINTKETDLEDLIFELLDYRKKLIIQSDKNS